jgi:hypothetical protein
MKVVKFAFTAIRFSGALSLFSYASARDSFSDAATIQA